MVYRWAKDVTINELNVQILIIPFLWNIITMIYLAQQARKGRLSPLKFTIVFVLGFSITVSTVLITVIALANGVGLPETGFVALVFLMNLLIGFPVVYFLSKFVIEKYFPNWSSETNYIKVK